MESILNSIGGFAAFVRGCPSHPSPNLVTFRIPIAICRIVVCIKAWGLCGERAFNYCGLVIVQDPVAYLARNPFAMQPRWLLVERVWICHSFLC